VWRPLYSARGAFALRDLSSRSMRALATSMLPAAGGAAPGSGGSSNDTAWRSYLRFKFGSAPNWAQPYGSAAFTDDPTRYRVNNVCALLGGAGDLGSNPDAVATDDDDDAAWTFNAFDRCRAAHLPPPTPTPTPAADDGGAGGVGGTATVAVVAAAVVALVVIGVRRQRRGASGENGRGHRLGSFDVAGADGSDGRLYVPPYVSSISDMVNSCCDTGGGDGSSSSSSSFGGGRGSSHDLGGLSPERRQSGSTELTASFRGSDESPIASMMRRDGEGAVL